MSILCGTDFSPGAEMAAWAAARLARRRGTGLVLAHVTQGPRSEGVATIERQLQTLAATLSRELEVEIEIRVAAGPPAEGLAKLAGELRADLVVVAAVSQATGTPRWWTGSTAERVAQVSPVPVLVVREGSWVERWSSGDVPLEILVAFEPGSPTSHAALRWATALAGFGPAELSVVQVAWPFGEHARLGIAPPIPLDHLRPEVGQVLVRDLEACGRQLGAPADTRYFVTHGFGRTEYVLADEALRHGADLLVVGTHQRSGIARVWQGSVSRGAIHIAGCSVVCVPAAAEREVLAPDGYRRVVVAIDFSALASRAIPFAQAMVGSGTVHLVTVAHRATHGEREALRQKLLAVVASVPWRDAGSTVEVVDHPDVAGGICAAAERSGADAICLTTRGRTGVVRLALGSQAQAVVERSRLPVLLVPAPRET